MIVQKVEMSPGQPLDLGQRRVDGLGIERSSDLEERFVLTEVADMRATA
jgi:hypothetical protein